MKSYKRNSADKESMNSTNETAVKQRKYRQYDGGYSEFGFMSTESNDQERT